VLDTHPLNTTDWSVVAVTIVLPVVVVEIVKAVSQRFGERRQARNFA
jgi:hypothetical protein